MNSNLKCVDGLYYPEFHAGWGGCAEELFHYTSRYFACTQAFLRNLADQRQFNMSGYQANNLSKTQRHLMAAILAFEPDLKSARGITQIVRAVINGESEISESLADSYRDHLKLIPQDVELVYSARTHHHSQPDVAPLDPFLNLAGRLNLPVAVHKHHLEVPLKALAQHLDSPNPALRNSLQEAILNLHFAGYALKNHPGLTHREARELGDESSL
ncbi:endonuclease [Candidatus Thiodiazotropha sp. CDECU1]|uniref:endonuclease n=1 Tax=Candidatus Thiodiazotropha sp. CDECU1 TaxID=3065865 RepID=UPI00292E098D|nr:endonuclease [Candidatus Thiodiazotropha sp. CDECU1]